MDINAIVLEVGSNMGWHSKKSRLIHNISGKPIINWVRDTLLESGIQDQLYIVGHYQDQIRKTVGERFAYIFQDETKSWMERLEHASSFLEGRTGITLLIMADQPMVTSKTIKSLIQFFKSGSQTIVMGVSKEPENTDAKSTYILEEDGVVKDVFEKKDLSEQEESNYSLVSNIYCFNTSIFLSYLGQYQGLIKAKQYFQETLKDDALSFLKFLLEKDQKISTYRIPKGEHESITSREILRDVQLDMNERICKKHISNGVTIYSTENTWIEDQVEIGADSIIYPGCIIQGKSKIGENVTLQRGCVLKNARVGKGSTLIETTVTNSKIGRKNIVGPYTNIEGETVTANRCKIGSYTYLNRAKVGNEVTIEPYACLSNIEMGDEVRIGCNTVVIDEQNKKSRPVVLGYHAQIGSRVSLYAPLKVGDNMVVPSEMTVNQDIIDQKDIG